MPKILLAENESIDGALRRLKKKLEREGTLKVLKARKYYEKPSEKKRRKIRSSKTRRK
ncbi:MAG: 30S ribosomal protein S21 [Candidatus Omnitrophica bacterium]|nr:30S ribosomal protein S21 [Candidatus Omnitrophota bacterium]